MPGCLTQPLQSPVVAATFKTILKRGSTFKVTTGDNRGCVWPPGFGQALVVEAEILKFYAALLGNEMTDEAIRFQALSDRPCSIAAVVNDAVVVVVVALAASVQAASQAGPAATRSVAGPPTMGRKRKQRRALGGFEVRAAVCRVCASRRVCGCVCMCARAG